MFTALITSCWIKELISLIDWIAIFTTFAGIIVI